jgi:eukaryotic-like serine/threonine-protein kinase
MGLSASQMALMSRLLDEALPLDASSRRAWLERLSPEYSDIAPALWEALLPQQSRAGGPKSLGTLPKLPAGRSGDEQPASRLQAGARVGPYELLRPLGAGGMAEVWLARRADGALKRTVALKIPTLMLARSELEQRFARERDILATLEHPHIARLYDAGIDSASQPYLAMEYVAGEPLSGWCDAHRLPVVARLELCLQVLDALQYAHDKHVIHRDLKPSNILVTDSSQVRLLDFGVAKLLEEEADQPQLTSVYGRALTPDYASPELLRGERLDARCDLYSFGVVLYELLTGIRPYQLQSARSIGVLEQAIARVEVEKPSVRAEPQAATLRATTPEGLARQLRGDLDAIVMKTLAKTPAERYASAAELARDLRSYLEGRPVMALPARLRYRLRKFVRRNRTVMAVSSAAAAAVLIAFAYVVYRDSVRRAVGSNAATVSVAALPEKSIAVLPFVNMSPDREQDYFSDGLTEEMINLLSQITDLRVPARTSSFYFKGRNESIASIARQLGVTQLLEGSVRKAGNHIRISAELIRADNGYHVWSQTYDRDDTDLFAVQDDIAKAVVSALQLKLRAGIEEKGSRGTINSEAYLQYLRASQLDQRDSIESRRLAVEAYGRAIALDPNYAAAYAGLALSEATLADRTGDSGGVERATRDVDRAIALAPTDANGYSARSYLRTVWLWDWSGAQADIEQALSLGPRTGSVLRRYARLLAVLGRLPEAIAAQSQAAELDPLSSVAWDNLGIYYTSAGDYAGGDTALARAMEIEPASVIVLTHLGMLRLLEGRPLEALGAFRKIDQEGFRLAGIVMAEHSLGHAPASEQALAQLIARHAHEQAYQIAEACAWRGETDQAFEWLERAYRQRDGGVSLVKFAPMLKSLRTDPRFQTLLHTLKLPE